MSAQKRKTPPPRKSSPGNDGSATGAKAARRNAAREKAREIAEAQRRKERRSKLILRVGVAVVVVALAVTIGAVIIQSNKPGPAPANYIDGGITFGKDLAAVASPDAESVPKGLKAASENTNPGAAHLKVYFDVQCPVCKSFEQLNGANIKTWATNGSVAAEYVPVAFLDRLSSGTKYSTRGANAVACFSDVAPTKYLDYLTTLYDNQPEENGTGLTDAQLISYAKQAGADPSAPIHAASGEKAMSFSKCVTSGHYTSYVTTQTAAAAKAGVNATPTVELNGKAVDGGTWQDPNAFSLQVLTAAGALKDADNKGTESNPAPSATGPASTEATPSK